MLHIKQQINFHVKLVNFFILFRLKLEFIKMLTSLVKKNKNKNTT